MTDEFSVMGFMHTAFFPEDARYCCVINPKSACSTVKYNLWAMEYEMGKTDYTVPNNKRGGAVHRKENNPLRQVGVNRLASIQYCNPVFSFVRNPFSRILSCYLDKIAGNKKEKRFLLYNMGCNSNIDISFRNFVDHLLVTDSREMDRHWAPQSFLTQISDVNYDFIGAVENLDEDIGKVLEIIRGDNNGSNQEGFNFKPHSTSATDRIKKFYEDDLAEKVFMRYENDFKLFGYSSDINDVSNPPDQRLQKHTYSNKYKISNRLKDLIGLHDCVSASKWRKWYKLLYVFSRGKARQYTNMPEIFACLGECHLLAGMPEKALDHYLIRASEANPNVVRYWKLIAHAYLSIKEYDMALSAVERMIDIGPGRPPSLRLAAKCHRKLGNENAAKEYLNLAYKFESIRL